MDKNTLIFLGIILFILFLSILTIRNGYVIQVCTNCSCRGGYGGFIDNRIGSKPFNFSQLKQPDLPECYIAKGNECVNGYKVMGHFYPDELIHCCKPPHYMIQGIYHDVAQYMIFESGMANQLYMQYNCSFDISRKLYCTDVNDCYERPDLEGCEKLDCNWCCYNTCTLMGCGSFDYQFNLSWEDLHDKIKVNPLE